MPETPDLIAPHAPADLPATAGHAAWRALPAAVPSSPSRISAVRRCNASARPESQEPGQMPAQLIGPA